MIVLLKVCCTYKLRVLYTCMVLLATSQNTERAAVSQATSPDLQHHFRMAQYIHQVGIIT